jgi:uncharacterized membrane protein
MTGRVILEFASLFCTGILAGEELVVRYGVHPALAALDEQTQIQARQGLIRRLRIVVPAIIGPTVLSAIAALVFGAADPGSGFRWAGALTLFAFIVITFAGTVPINQKINAWQPSTPPSNWRAQITRWERLDVFRSSAAILAFAFFLTAAAYD